MGSNADSPARVTVCKALVSGSNAITWLCARLQPVRGRFTFLCPSPGAAPRSPGSWRRPGRHGSFTRSRRMRIEHDRGRPGTACDASSNCTTANDDRALAMPSWPQARPGRAARHPARDSGGDRGASAQKLVVAFATTVLTSRSSTTRALIVEHASGTYEFSARSTMGAAVPAVLSEPRSPGPSTPGRAPIAAGRPVPDGLRSMRWLQRAAGRARGLPSDLTLDVVPPAAVDLTEGGKPAAPKRDRAHRPELTRAGRPARRQQAEGYITR
jgi:hypothetical protein